MVLGVKLPPLVKQSLRSLVFGYYALVVRLRSAYEYIFVLSHMRSGSSLLTHLLVSHPAICGFGETHIGYTSQRQFKELIYRVLFVLHRFPLAGNERYMLDKVLHDAFFMPQYASLLLARPVRVIFLLRRPQETLASLINTLHYSEQEATTYYCQRLATLEQFAQYVAVQKPCIFITYTQLVEQTAAVFSLLQTYLELDQPLSEYYTVFPTTGRPGVGDISPHIRAGRILRPHERERGPSLVLAPACLQRAEAAFCRCAAYLAEHCLTPHVPD